MRRAVRFQASSRSFEPGQIICRRGDEADAFFVILSGSVQERASPPMYHLYVPSLCMQVPSLCMQLPDMRGVPWSAGCWLTLGCRLLADAGCLLMFLHCRSISRLARVPARCSLLLVAT